MDSKPRVTTLFLAAAKLSGHRTVRSGSCWGRNNSRDPTPKRVCGVKFMFISPAYDFLRPRHYGLQFSKLHFATVVCSAFLPLRRHYGLQFLIYSLRTVVSRTVICSALAAIFLHYGLHFAAYVCANERREKEK